MRKRMIAFYDVWFYTIICSPLIVVSIILLSMLVTKGTSEWIFENWYLVVAFAISFMLPLGGAMLVRYCQIENNLIHFHYFPFTTTWQQASDNIDIKWNQDIHISEIKNIEIVKLTKPERETKVFYKHWFNKYLKVNLKYGHSKYVYVANYSNHQIKQMIEFLTKENT